jgi:hypothetical protein
MERKLPFTKINYILFAIGLLMLVAGYWLMSIGPHDSFASLTLAPIIVMCAYVIVLPVAILKKSKKNEIVLDND